MDVGLELRQARERRGMSLLQLSRITKINTRILDAIEDADGERLPAAVFTRSFVRTYAAEVGLDQDDVWRRYAEQFEPPDAALAMAAEPDRRSPSEPLPVSTGARVLQGRFGSTAVLALAALSLYFLAGRNDNEAQPDTAPQIAVGATGIVPSPPPPPQPVGTSGTAPAPADSLHLTIAPTGPCWIGANVKGQSVLAALLNPGDRRNVDAPADVTLRAGDPSTCAFSINGKPAKVPGAPGQAVTVLITTENYTQFLVPR